MIITLKNNARPKREAFKTWNKFKDNIYQTNKPISLEEKTMLSV